MHCLLEELVINSLTYVTLFIINADPFASQLDPIVPTPYSRKLAPESHSAPAAAQPQTMLEAVRDVVTIRPTDGRQKVSRSQTGGVP